MKNNRKYVTTKKMIISSTLLAACVLPTLSLTSCGQAVQYFLPFFVGGSKECSPFYDSFITLNENEINDQQSKLLKSSGSQGGANINVGNTVNMKEYLPSNYIFYRSPTSTSNYGFYQPHDVKSIINAGGDQTKLFQYQ
jgi:hypothetical protein